MVNFSAAFQGPCAYTMSPETRVSNKHRIIKLNQFGERILDANDSAFWSVTAPARHML